jgi:hypothetical protein
MTMPEPSAIPPGPEAGTPIGDRPPDTAAPRTPPLGDQQPAVDMPPPGAPLRAAAPTTSGHTSRAGIVAGIVLVVVGGLFLLGRVASLTLGADAWPLWIIVPGVAMLTASFATRTRAGLGLAIPGTIVTIVGLILWVQASNGLYATWAYAWALVAPTGPGLAMLVYGLFLRDRGLAAEGLRTTMVGLALFLGFAMFFEGVLGLSGERVANLDQVLPYAAIGLGVVLVVASLFDRKSEPHRA